MKNILKNKLVRTTAIILIFSLVLILTLQTGTWIRQAWRPWTPDYAMEDIEPTLQKDELLQSDYDFLYKQTGLSKLGIDSLIESGQKRKILLIQEQFFEEQECYLKLFAPFTGYMRRSGKSAGAVAHTVLENGDILYSPSTFFSFVKLGHSALVSDGKSATIMQASGYSSPVMKVSSNSFFSRPAFIILRVNADEKTRSEAAEYAEQNLLGIKYDLLAGIFGDKAPDNLNSTHCSHLIWYSYKQLGIDIDSNGGKIVTPDDILYSDSVSIVQIFGIDPEIFKDN